MASRAAYMKEYRKVTRPIKERLAVKEGIALCVKFLREIVGGQAKTGYQAALLLERFVGTESAELVRRRELIRSMQQVGIR
jgi:hypothetical protein